MHLVGLDADDPYLVERTEEIRERFDGRVPMLVNGVNSFGPRRGVARATEDARVADRRGEPVHARRVAARRLRRDDRRVRQRRRRRRPGAGAPAPRPRRRRRLARGHARAALTSAMLRAIRTFGPEYLAARHGSGDDHAATATARPAGSSPTIPGFVERVEAYMDAPSGALMEEQRPRAAAPRRRAVASCAASRMGRVRRPRDARRAGARWRRDAPGLAGDRGHPPRARPLDAAVHHRPLPGRLRALLGRLAPRQPDDHGLRAVRGDRRVALRAADYDVVGISGGEPFVERRGLSLAARRITEEGKRLVVYTSGVWAKRPDPPAWIARRARPLARPSSSAPTPSTRRASATATTSTPRGRSRAPGRGSSCRCSTSTTWSSAPRPAARRRSGRLRGLCRAAPARAAHRGPRRRRLHAHEAPARAARSRPARGRVADDPLRRRRHGVLQRERDHGLGPARAAPQAHDRAELGVGDERASKPTRCCARSAASGPGALTAHPRFADLADTRVHEHLRPLLEDARPHGRRREPDPLDRARSRRRSWRARTV